MKKVLLSLTLLVCSIIGLCQCPSTFNVINNGAGGCSNPFPGNGVQTSDGAYKRDGVVQLAFSIPVASDVTPVITAIRAIISPIGQPVVTGPNIDMKFVLKTFTTAGRTIGEYCFYSQNNLNLNNASGSRYQVDVTFMTPTGSTNTTCNIQQNSVLIPLPVHFKSFNANRTTSSNVSIVWTTASEQNNKGFNVQKNVGGEWKTVVFVFSQAEGGNSSSDLTYSFKDANNEKGITQYRIQQVDLDGNAKYSDIRAIRGEGTAAKIVVYPNPSSDGKLNLVFEGNSEVRDVQVGDMQGRIVKSYKGITNNILVIEKLSSGFYTIKITNRNTAATSVEKVVVK